MALAPKLADDAKARFGIMALIVGGLSITIAVLCFISDAEIITSLDLGKDAGVIGWYLMALGMLFSAVGLILGATISSKR
ncbi:MAG: hypothetical protein HQ483_18285 [Rhodospirillales bacterium]|nr:hypothetical protein [Rhodospirillales bacterium]